jgi:recombination protein RecT
LSQPDQTTAVIVAQEHPSFPVVAAALEKRLPSITAFLGGSTSAADRFRRVVLQSLVRNPDLLKATPDSIASAAAEAAQLGLEPSGAIGGAHLVRFGDKAQLLIDYRGLVELARRSDQIEDVWADVVREKDHFEARRGLHPDLVHEPDYSAERGPNPDTDGNRVIHAYAVAIFKSGHRRFDVMSRAEVEAIRARSRAANNGPWVTDWSEMAKKSVTRRLCKTLPLHAQAREIIAADEEREYGGPRVVVEGPPEATGSLVERLRARRAPMGANQQPGQETEVGRGTAAEPSGTPAPASQPQRTDEAGDGDSPGEAAAGQATGPGAEPAGAASPSSAIHAPGPGAVPAEKPAAAVSPGSPTPASGVVPPGSASPAPKTARRAGAAGRKPTPAPAARPAIDPPTGGGHGREPVAEQTGSVIPPAPNPAPARVAQARNQLGFEPDELSTAIAVQFEGLDAGDLSAEEWDTFVAMALDYVVIPELGTEAYRALPVGRKSKVRAEHERRLAAQSKRDAEASLAAAATGRGEA